MNISELVQTRYSTKVFDPTRKLSDQQLVEIRELLQMSPSSTNSQPWHFVITTTEEGKARLAKATQGNYKVNEARLLGAACVVVFCALSDIDRNHIHDVTNQEDADGRFATPEAKAGAFETRTTYTDMHRFDLKDAPHWIEKQVYLNIGNFLLGTAVMGLNALPMEGIDKQILDTELSLREKNLTSVALVCVGYASQDDPNALHRTPKSRFSQDRIISTI